MSRCLIRSALRWLRLQRLRLLGVEIVHPRYLGSAIDCRRGFLTAPGRIQIGTGAGIEQGVVLHAYGGLIRIGPAVFLGPYAVIYGHGGVEIGEETLVSMHCRILSSNHAVPSPGTSIRTQPDVHLRTKIGRDVWLGAGVTVLGGVTIGDGCVVGAGAVVTHDVPPYSISIGVPAEVVRQRQ